MKKFFPIFGIILMFTSCTFSIVSLPVEEAEFLLSDSLIQILDVRSPQEFSLSHIEDAVNVDLHSELFDEQVNSYLSKSRPVLVYCSNGNKSHVAAEKLEALGYNPVYNLSGGVESWIAEGKHVVTSADILEKGFKDINEICSYIHSCGYYMMSVMVGDTVAHMRPFTNLTVYDGKFYIMANNNDRLKSIVKINPRVELCAYSPKSTAWVRIFGYLRAEEDVEIRNIILNQGDTKLSKAVNSDNTDVYYLENIKGKYVVFGTSEKFLNL